MRDAMRAVAALATVILLTAALAGCGAKEAVKQTIQQGVETTTTGTYNVVPGNQAQDAVDSLNQSQQQQLPQETAP